MTAFFKGKWGQKSSQEVPKPAKGQTPPDDEDDEEDNASSGFKKDPIRRNSRFYRSMRKKRLASSEQPQSKSV
ncbi:unnamed protein product [Merluccius merluccius]